MRDFGGIDADADELLRDAFKDHPAYQDARAHRRFVIVGRKGSGKTAIFKKLITERSATTFSYGHTFDDYPWHHHDLQAQVGVPEERRYIHSWKYLILVSLSKILLNQDQSQPWNEASAEAGERLESFIVDSYGSRDPDLRQLFSPNKELQIKGTFKAPFLEVAGERVRINDLPTHIQELNSAISDSVLVTLNPDCDYFVCFDQLDLGFNVEDPTYSQRLTGLILAARELSQGAKERGTRMSVVVFLRDDIYELLQFEDKNKITENHLSSISWSQNEGDFTLKSLMERRFSVVLEDEVTWEMAFDEEKRMPGRQTKYAHICDRTFLRPRDMIKFCNEILISHKDRVHREPELVRNEDIHGAKDRYSGYLLRELEDEIHKHVPAYREYLEVLKAIGTEEFTREAFAAAWGSQPELAQHDKTPSEALGELFEFSIIGYLKPGGWRGGSRYQWRYRDSRARFSQDTDVYRVHAGFKEALDLVRGGRAIDV